MTEQFIFEDAQRCWRGANPRRTLTLDSPQALQELRRELASPERGPAVGYLGYGVSRWLEKLPDRHRHMPIPDGEVLFFEKVEVEERGRPARRSVGVPARGDVEWSSNCRHGQFLDSVQRAKDAIAAGEAFQIVLSQRWDANFPGSGALDLYDQLRQINPSPYMFLLQTRRCTLIGTSPEMLVRVSGGIVETRPIAGTRPRGRTAQEDTALETDLLANEKENAEHLMLVDLGRNDIGRVARPGTVHVTEFRTVERYSDVMHLVSHVRGELRDEVAPIDALLAAFPAGTVTGAPKIRAMELIDELEFSHRGPYAGAVLWSRSADDLDSCITIRTILLRDEKAYVQAGAGIVFDSDPAAEFEETVNKAAALKRAVEMCNVQIANRQSPIANRT